MTPLASTRWITWGSNPRAHYAQPGSAATICGLVVGANPRDAEESVAQVQRCPLCSARRVRS